MATGIPARLTAREGREFGLKVGLAFAVIALVLVWRDRPTGPMVTGILGALWIAGGLLVPGSLGPVYRAWMRLALVISKVTTPVFLGIVYYIVLTPVGLLRRTFGKSPLVQPMRDGSYWVRRENSNATASRMTRPF